MTNFDKIKGFDYNALIDFLDNLEEINDTFWIKWFDATYCKKCESITCSYKDSTHTFECSWCELNHKCYFFQETENIPDNKNIIKLWLDSEAE